jgi:hypothetical protein
MTQKTRRKAGTHPFVLDTDLPPDANGRGVTYSQAYPQAKGKVHRNSRI